jgi:GAF domain-containing protein
MSKTPEIRNQLSQLEIAAGISKAAISILDTDELLNSAVELIQEKFSLDYVGIFLVSENRQEIVLQASSGKIKQNKNKFDLNDQSLIGWCILNGQPRLADDEADTLLPETRSEMDLPLVGREVTIGALSIQSRKPGAFSENDLDILQTIAGQLAIAIENARLLIQATDSQRVAEDLVHETLALQQLSQALSSTLDVNQIVEIFFQTCTKMLGFDFVVFSLVDPRQQRIKAIAGAGITNEHIKRANHPLDSGDIMADIIRTGHTEAISGWDDRFDKDTYDAEEMAEWGQRVFTPIRLREENIGIVEVGFNKNVQTKIEETQIRLLRAFIDQTALALDNARRHEASQRALRREELIREFTTKVRSSNNIDIILQYAVKEIGDALPGKRTYVHLASPTNGHDS